MECNSGFKDAMLELYLQVCGGGSHGYCSRGMGRCKDTSGLRCALGLTIRTVLVVCPQKQAQNNKKRTSEQLIFLDPDTLPRTRNNNHYNTYSE